MAIVHRRTFVGKIGQADAIVKHLKAGDKMFKKYGGSLKTRVLSDHNSGRTDRVVWEWEGKDLGSMDAEMARVMGNAKAKAEFDKWFAQLSGMIHYAEVDNFQTH